MKIIVTGGAGFIGSHLAERLAGLGHQVVGLDCFLDNYAQALKALNVSALREQGIEVMPIDLATDDLQSAVVGAEAIYHLAGQPGISATTPFDAYVRNNLIATQRLLQAVQALPTLRGFINISTSSVYGSDASGAEDAEPRPTSYYGVTKLAAEQLVMAYERDRGLPACSLRLFSVYGPRERPEKLYPQLIRAILEDRQFPLFDGSQDHLRSYTYVDDIVDGLVLTLEQLDRCRGQIFNIGSPMTMTTGEGMRIVEELLGKQARVAVLPRRFGDQLRTHANIDKARRLLGYRPLTTAREGLAQEIAWYRQHVHGKIALEE